MSHSGRDDHAGEAVSYFNNSDLAEKPVEDSIDTCMLYKIYIKLCIGSEM